eukprot:TRINITY_DN70863_c0_g1_i1.p1 TRINITY_DN70863_c0_g1~~TRINITY_DN70863_c0_g1_i1.p1  ORF type:complete len:258 (-),score=28.76 TRINITY_DN70863_c0_g1_i1:30-719(-)
MADALLSGAMQTHAAFTVEPMICTRALKADLQRNMRDFKMEEGTDGVDQVLVFTNGNDGCFQCLCPGCAPVPFRYSIRFGASETAVKNETSYFNMPFHKISEINREASRVLAILQNALLKEPQTGASSALSGSPAGREWEITCTKQASLGIKFQPEAGKWKVSEVFPGGTVEAFNSSNPESAVLLGDYITKINGLTPSRDVFQSIADGDTVTFVIQSMRDAAPAQEYMV